MHVLHRRSVRGAATALLVPAVLAAVLVAPGVISAASASTAPASAAPEPVPTQGTLLRGPDTPIGRTGHGIRTASSQYVLHDVAPYDDATLPSGAGAVYSVVRLSDGITVRRFEGPDAGSDSAPVLRGSSLVQRVEPGPERRAVEVRDAATGTLQRTIETTGNSVIHAEPTWVLLSRRTGPTTGDNGVWVRRADGSEVAVPGRFFSAPAWIGGHDRTAYLSAYEGDLAVDLATGARTPIDLPGEARLSLVTPTLLVGEAPTGQRDRTVQAVRRPTLEPVWSTVVGEDYRNTVVGLGDGIAVVHRPDGWTREDGDQLRRVDLATGALGRPIAEHVLGRVDTGDGRSVLVLSDTTTGRLAVVGESGVRPLADLPLVPQPVADVGLVGDRVTATWAHRSDLTTTSARSPGPWTTSRAEPGFENGAEKTFEVAGDSVLADNGRDGSHDGERSRLFWSAGVRDLWATSTTLSRGGRYVTRVDFGGRGVEPTSEVREVSNGAVVASVSSYEARPVDGTWLWDHPDASAVLRGTDLTGARAERRVQLAADCARGRVLLVRGRWGWVTCGGQTRVVDLDGILPALVTDGGSSGGNGFTVSVRPHGEDSSAPPYAWVTDLVSRETRAYGPLRHLHESSGRVVAPDDAGGAAFVYADPRGQVRRVELDWLTPQALLQVPPRGPAPSAGVAMTSSPQVAPLVASTTDQGVLLRWTSTGAQVHQVRVRDGAGDWVLPPSLSALTAPEVNAVFRVGQERCYSARAEAWDGSTTPWTAPVCQRVDGRAPVLGTPTGSAPHPTTLKAPATYAVTATDDDQVASYDVQAQTAARGRPLGAWTDVVTAGASATWTSAAQLPGSQLCLRSRARDRAGNVSDWAPARCSSAPVDDRSLVRSSGSSWQSSAAAIGRTYVRLSRTGASVSLRSQTGRTVGVWVLRGPGLGSAEVYAAGRSIGRVSFAASTTRRELVLLPVTGGFTGTVKLVSRSSARVHVDAMTVVR